MRHYQRDQQVTTTTRRSGPLSSIKVLDLGTMIAGPTVGQMLADFGADVIKLEHPTGGDSLRTHGQRVGGDSLWWKLIGRNKRSMGLDIGKPAGRDIFLRLLTKSDVVVEAFRPGTLERYNLGWDALAAANPRIILLRVSGFGQTGPYAPRPAFGTLIEAMSGFAHSTGEAGGPPTLPPFGLADSIAGMTGFGAVLTALYDRDVNGSGGQVIDLSILEAMLATLGPQSLVYDQLKHIQARAGNRSKNNAPRNTYKTSDHRWVAISASATSVAERVMRTVGCPEVVEKPWFRTGRGRAAHAEELDGPIQTWISARTLEDVLGAFEAAEVAAAPVYDIEQLVRDPHVMARGVFQRVPDEELGSVQMPDVVFRLSESPGGVRHAGKPFGADTDDILQEEVGLRRTDIKRLRDDAVVG